MLWAYIFGIACGFPLGVVALLVWQHSPFEQPGSVDFYRRIVKMHQRSYYSNIRGGWRNLAANDLSDLHAAERDLAKAIEREQGKRQQPGSVWP